MNLDCPEKRIKEALLEKYRKVFNIDIDGEVDKTLKWYRFPRNMSWPDIAIAPNSAFVVDHLLV